MPWKPLQTPSDVDLAELKKEYSGKVKLLVDENAGPEVVEFLSDAFNTKYVGDFNLCGRPDEDVFATAWRERRVIITHDGDSLDDRRFPPHRNPGVIRIAPGADGKDDEGLRKCLVIAMMIAGDLGSWYIGKKIDFTSSENLTIYGADGTKSKFRWPRRGPAMEWED